MDAYRNMQQLPVMRKEAGFWFVQDPIRYVPGVYQDPRYSCTGMNQPTIKTVRAAPRLCHSWFEAFTVSRAMIVRNWFRPSYERANQLSREMCGQGAIRPVVENEAIVGYETMRGPRWLKTNRAHAVSSVGTNRALAWSHGGYVRFKTRTGARLARVQFAAESFVQPLKRWALDR